MFQDKVYTVCFWTTGSVYSQLATLVLDYLLSPLQPSKIETVIPQSVGLVGIRTVNGQLYFIVQTCQTMCYQCQNIYDTA